MLEHLDVGYVLICGSGHFPAPAVQHLLPHDVHKRVVRLVLLSPRGLDCRGRLVPDSLHVREQPLLRAGCLRLPVRLAQRVHNGAVRE
jgi:hypothetical protein